MSQIDTDYCRLRLAVEDMAELCPRELCAFWEPAVPSSRAVASSTASGRISAAATWPHICSRCANGWNGPVTCHERK